MANVVVSEIKITGENKILNDLAQFVKSEDYDFDLEKITDDPSTQYSEDEKPHINFTDDVYSFDVETEWIAPYDELKILSKRFPTLRIELVVKAYDDGIWQKVIYENGEDVEFIEEEMRYADEDEGGYVINGLD